jgi:hypothetical protein
MANVMATFMAYFVQMISYCAQGCILKWQTMLPKEVTFYLHENFIFHFSSAQNEFFCEGPSK